MSATSTTETVPVVNLRETRKDLAASKQRHPAGSKAPAKKAAKPAAKKADTGSAAKIRWTPQDEKDAKGQCESVGVAGDREYRITREGDAWKAVVKVGGKTTTLAENAKSGKAAWSKCVAHNRSAA